MESEPAQSSANSYDDQSPYAPPPAESGASQGYVALKQYVEPFPIQLTVVATVMATVISGVFFIIGMGHPASGFLSFLFPFVAVAVFVGVCMSYFQAGGAAARSLAWKTLMVLLIPAASVLLFVPTCFGTGLFMFATLSGTSLNNAVGPVLMFIPLFAGYFVTFAVIALRLRYRMPKPPVEAPGPWSEIAGSRSDFS